MKKIIAVVILAVFAAGFFGLMVPRHVLNSWVLQGRIATAKTAEAVETLTDAP
jgi:uncharacterized membrane protein YraQ (UPF0718 family)